MKKPKSIFLITYLVFHLTLFLGAIYVNYRSEDFGYLLWLRGKMTLMIYIMAAGLILYGINVFIMAMETRSHQHKKDALEKEVNALKAKMFDLQESAKATGTPDTVITETTAEDITDEES